MGRPKNFNREEVLEKAMPLFWKRGFADTGLQDLEQATGVNKSGLYSEFKNKEDLFLEALRHYTKTREGIKLMSVEPLGFHNLENFLKYKLDRPKEEALGCFCVNSMRELSTLPGEAPEIILENRKKLKQLFYKNIAAEKTKMPTEALTELFSTFFSGFCIEHNLKGSKASGLKKVDEMMQALRSL